MRKITFGLRLLIACALCFAGRYAMAQEVITVDGVEVPVAGTVEVDVDVVEQTAYSEDYAEFDLDGVLSILGINDITNASQYIVNVTTNEAVENESDGWRDPSGDMAGWGTTGGVCVKINDPESGLVDYIGCYDESWEAGDTYTALWAFVAGGKAAIVKVVITFVEDTSAKAPEAELDLNNIEIVGMAELTTERYSYNGFETTDCEVSVSGIATLLGVDAAEMEEWFEDGVYVAYNNDIGVKVDSLQLLYETDGWLQRTSEYWGEDLGAGDILNECCASYYSDASHYFIQAPEYDAENDVVTFIVGQYPGNLAVGDSLYTDLYVMNGTKAYVIRHHMVIVEAPYTGGPADLTKVGEETIEITQYPTTDYSITYFYPDLTTAADLLGCSESNLSLNALGSATSFASNSTANNGGWWFDENGYVSSWGSSPVFIEPYESGDYSILTIGQMPSLCEEGDVYNIPLYLTYGESYYLVNVQLTIIPEPAIDYDNLENVATYTLTITQEYDEEYTFSTAAGIDFDLIENAIGTTDPTLMSELTPEEAEENDGIQFTRDYTCTPYPGFWMTSDGYVTTWGTDSYWGVSTAVEASEDQLLFSCCQFPGLTADGDTYNGTFYLLNRENSKMITVKLTYIIGEVIDYEDVGSGSVTVPVGGDEMSVDFPLDDIAEALGATLDELNDNYSLRAANGNTATTRPGDGLEFGLDGVCVASGDGVFGIWFEEGQIYSWSNADMEEGYTATTQLYFLIGTSRYTLTITFMNADDYAGVAGVAAPASESSAIYDLSGRQVSKAQKGIYIQNGKKILVK